MFEFFSHIFHTRIRREFEEDISRSIPSDDRYWPQYWKQPVFKEYGRMPRVALDTPRSLKLPLSDALEKRKSVRSSTHPAPCDATELSTLLYHGCGINTARSREHKSTYRFYPSSGRRYPLEVYVNITKITGVASGVYHYNVRDHALEHIPGIEYGKASYRSIYSRQMQNAPAILHITGVWERVCEKYGNYGYALMMLEAGHMAQNLLLAAAALSLDVCPLAEGNVRSGDVEKLLDVPPERETPLYIITTGNRQ